MLAMPRINLHTRLFLVSTLREQKDVSVKLDGKKSSIGKIDQQKLLLAFTCKKCDERSSHVISKQAYSKGTVLVECPKCKNRHLIADHLKIFNDKRITVEDILRAKGELISKDSNDLVFEDLPEVIKKKLSGSQ